MVVTECNLHVLEKSPKSLEFMINKTLVESGIPPHVRGYQYIREAIVMLFQDENNIHGITKNMYPEIARKYDTTPIRVERGIRHAIEIAWNREGDNQLKVYFPNDVVRPTNSEFLAYLYRGIALKIYEE